MTPPAPVSNLAHSPHTFFRPSAKADLHCGPASLTKIAKRFDTPVYVYSAQALLLRLQLLEEAFAGQSHLLCYSVKANSALAILKMLARRGVGFDIVSGGELERVLTVDRRAATRVVFSGVGKTADELDLALRARIRIFNVESEQELELLAERASRRGVRAPFALRVNPDVFAETHPYISTGLSEHKFGVRIGEARALYARARKGSRSRSLRATGVSVHIGSQIRDPEPFGAAAERVVTLVRELWSDGESGIRSIDLGGGLGIEYGRNAEWNPAETVRAYARLILGALAGLSAGAGPGVLSGFELLLEPGRFLVAEAGALLTRVVYTKQSGAKRFVITDAGMNDLIRPSLYGAYHAIEPVAAPKKDSKQLPVDIVGPVCESGDFFAKDRLLPPVKPGDLLAILDAGAYGMSLSSNYNSRPRPPEVLIDGKRVRLIRRRETTRDQLAPERF